MSEFGRPQLVVETYGERWIVSYAGLPLSHHASRWAALRSAASKAMHIRGHGLDLRIAVRDRNGDLCLNERPAATAGRSRPSPRRV